MFVLGTVALPWFQEGGGGLTGCLKCHETASCGFFEVVGKILIIHHISITIVIKIVMATLKKHTHFCKKIFSVWILDPDSGIPDKSTTGVHGGPGDWTPNSK